MYHCLQHSFRGWCSIPYEGTKATMYLDDKNSPSQQHASPFADHDLFKVIYSAQCAIFDKYFANVLFEDTIFLSQNFMQIPG